MTITHPLLRSSAAKLAWAEHHREALQSEVLRVQSDWSHGAPLQADLDPSTGNHVRTIKSMPDFSEFERRVSLGIGDVIACSRAALDHAVWHIVCDHVRGEANVNDPKGVAFPVFGDVTALDESRGGKVVKTQMPDRCWEVILQVQTDKPYPGLGGPAQPWGRWPTGIHPFALLQQLSNDDKHRLIPVVLFQNGQWSDPPHWLLADDRNWIDIDHASANYYKHMKVGVEVVSQRLQSRELHIENAGHVTPAPTLQGRDRVVIEMRGIVALVEFVLTEFQRVLPPPAIAL